MKYRSNWWAQITHHLHKRTGIVLFIFTILLASCEEPGVALSGLTLPEQPAISRGLGLLPIPSAPLPPARGDFDTLITAGNTRPTNIWSDGITMWVSDFDDNKLYAYDLRSKARDEVMDFALDAMNDRPTSIWSDGITMWVANNTAEPRITPWSSDEEREAASSIVDKIFAYKMSDGTRDEAKDFPALIAGNDFPSGLWSDGTTMWVADFEDSKLYAYDLRSKARDEAMDFALNAMNDRPTSIWSDGNTIWVADARDDQLYAYNLSDGAVNESEEFPALAPMNADPVGIWSDGSTMWVADINADKIFAYNLSDKAYNP